MQYIYFPKKNYAPPTVSSLFIPINRLVKIQPDKLFYFGSINLTITGMEGGSLTYQLDIDATQSRQEDIRRFTSEFPGLSNQFGNTASFCKPFLYFNYTFGTNIDPVFPEYLRTDDIVAEVNIEDGKRSYLFQRFINDDKYHYLTGNHNFGFSSNDSFIIQWDSRWKDGATTLPYGFIFGPDIEKAYYFTLTGSGENKVYSHINGNWTEFPCNAGENNPGQTAHHKMEFSDNRMLYDINGKRVAELSNSLDFDSFIIGLLVSGNSSAVFDNIIIEDKNAE